MGKKKEKGWTIIPAGENDIPENELIFSFQKAMLLSMVENETITVKQYDAAIKLLEKKNQKR